jgi:hypothetical protein
MRPWLHRVGSLIVVMIVTGFVVSSTTEADEKSQTRITGTYTDMRYVSEAGDVIGTEIKIVFTGSRFQGALQIAEGVPGELILVDVEQKANSVSFSIPESSPYPGSFAGAISGGALRGEFRFKSGGSAKVVLRRGKSYWD